MLPFFLQGAALGISAALSPGPFQSLVIRESLLGGLRRAAPVTFAPLIADIPIAVILVFVLRQAPQGFLQAIRLGGAGLLLYLAWGLWQQLRVDGGVLAGEAAEGRPAARVGRGLALGVAMLFLSPGPYLYWSTVLGPLLLAALQQSLAHALLFLLSFYAFSIGGLLVIAWALGRAGGISPAWRRGLQSLSLLLLVAVALWLLSDVLLA